MPSNQNPLGALPARFRRQRVLIVGCGDVGLRAAGQLGAPQSQRVRLLALTSSPERVRLLRACGITPLMGNLDEPASLRRLAGLAHRVIHLAPPPSERRGQVEDDPRTRALGRVLRLRTLPKALVYGSTTGVYGDCGGERVSEVRGVRPHTPRAQRRVDAEATMRFLGRSGVRVSVLRIPGIYAQDREGGTPRGRLTKGTPVLVSKEDVYTNHIQADDLARACVAALWRGKPQRVVNVTDDTDLKMGDYFDLAAGLYGLPRPPRISRSDANTSLPLMLLSFMNESRRLDNTRMKRELKLHLRYPHVRDGLALQGALFPGNP
ncbi:MAG: SDR family NAD(P)-dependent oxidoreductase [Limnohabitans sp.]|nr:SDR family NAD(P)-dependent oxidoreductase [Limnohabitans sp.]